MEIHGKLHQNQETTDIQHADQISQSTAEKEDWARLYKLSDTRPLAAIPKSLSTTSTKVNDVITKRGEGGGVERHHLQPILTAGTQAQTATGRKTGIKRLAR